MGKHEILSFFVIGLVDVSNSYYFDGCSVQIVQITMDLLSAFAAQQKIEEAALASSCASSMAQLWTISDRSIRTALLKSLKSLAPYLHKDLINKKIFDPLMSGFADSNSKYLFVNNAFVCSSVVNML